MVNRGVCCSLHLPDTASVLSVRGFFTTGFFTTG
jgi:hypothetical protein